MTFEHECLSNVRQGWERGLLSRDARKPPERWTGVQESLLCRLADGETIDQIEAAQPKGVRRGDILVALSILATRGLIRAPGDHIEITNMGFARAAELGERAA